MPLQGGSCFLGAARNQNKTKGPVGGHCGIHMPDTRPHTTPNPQTAFARVPAGQVAIAGPWVTPREPQRPKRGDSQHSSQKKCPAQTTARRPPEHTMATPNANQAPQGAGTSPRSPLVAMGGLWGCQKSANRPVATSMTRLGVTRILQALQFTRRALWACSCSTYKTSHKWAFFC